MRIGQSGQTEQAFSPWELKPLRQIAATQPRTSVQIDFSIPESNRVVDCRSKSADQS